MFSDYPYRQDRMGKMPSMRHLRASVSFPITELGLQEALEGVSFAKARRAHKSVQIYDFDVWPVLLHLLPFIVVNNTNSESNNKYLIPS